MLENHERDQIKLDPKYRGPFEVIEILDDRYHLRNLKSNRTFKCARDRSRPFPQCYVPTELDPFLSNDSDVDESI